MQKAEIKAIADYLADFEKGLARVDNRTRPTLGHLTEIEQVIGTLNDETFKTKDQELKPLLATLELKTRKCKECIERRLTVRN